MNNMQLKAVKMLEIIQQCYIGVFSLILVLLLNSNLYAQQDPIMTNNGLIYMNTGSIITVNKGSLKITDTLINNGTLNIINDFILDSNQIALVKGNGIYSIGGNWENNSNFVADNSEVILNGSTDQYIKGKKVTTFHNLRLEQWRYKILQIDARISNKLYLNDKELATDKYILYIDNADPKAIERENNSINGGFISSSIDSNGREGMLMRKTANHTNGFDPYLFPVGSSNSGEEMVRYRPITINPTIAVPDSFGVRFVNHDPSLDLYNTSITDTTICFVNNTYYHRIYHPTSQNLAKVSIYFDPNFDVFPGKWDGIAKWGFDDVRKINWWKNLGLKFDVGPFSTPVTNNYPLVQKQGVDLLPKMENYILMANRPAPVFITGDVGICFGNPTVVDYNGTGDINNTFKWDITGGTVLSQDPTKNNLTVDWGNTIGGNRQIRVTQFTGFGDCGSYTTSHYVNIYPKPDIKLDIYKGKVNTDLELNTDKNTQLTKLDTNSIFVNDLLSYISHNQGNANPTYFWDFGDGGTSSHMNPYHIYENSGVYTVHFKIANENACYNDTTFTIEVINGLVYPNVFTPNSDGHNDYFQIKASGMVEFHLQIFDRWGVLVFESNDPDIGWDGKSIASVDCAQGTYFYVLKAHTLNKSYDHSGFVTLIR